MRDRRRWRAIACLGIGLAASGCGASGAGTPETAEAPETDPLETVTGEELYRRGILLAQAGDLTRAEQYLAASMERGYEEERVLPSLLRVCIEASRLVAALEYAEPFLTEHPEEWPLRMLVGSIHMGLGRHERARDELERVVRDAPDEPAQAHYFLGVLFRDALDDAEASAGHFRRYLALEPEGPHVEEARAGLPEGEQGRPVRVERAPTPVESGDAPEGGPRRVEEGDAPETSSTDPAPEAAP